MPAGVPQQVMVPPLSLALIQRAMPNGVPWTVHRLRTLKPNETFCYYVGNLDDDIHRSSVWAPHYHELLESIRQTVLVLEQRHRIVVVATRRQVLTHRDFGVVVNMYYAIGIRQS
jgi:hypothetical protein